MRSALRLLLASLIMLAVSAGVMASGTGEGASPDDVVTITFLSPGEESARMGEFFENEFADRIMADLNTELDVAWSPWGQYWDKLTLTLAAQEPLDFYWDVFGGLSNRTSRREAAVLDDLLAEHGQNVLNVIGPDRFAATTINGNIMAIPSQRGPISEKFYSVLVRQDIMDSVGVDSIESLADLEAFAELALAQDPTLAVFTDSGYGLVKMLSREFFTDVKPTFFDPATSFYVDEFEDGPKVHSTFENKEFVQFISETSAEYVARGWMPETVLTEPDNNLGRFSTGSFLTRIGAVTRALEDLNGVRQSAPEAVLMEYLFNPDLPRYIDRPGNELVYITPYSRNPERTMQFLDWIYASQENHDLFIYGVEGKDYVIDEDGRLEQINTDPLFYEWMWRVTDYMRFPAELDQRAIDQMLTWDEDAMLSKLFGFTFDASELKAEQAQITSVMTEISPLMGGFEEFTDEVYDEYLQKLYDAGLERYRSSVEEQLAEYLGQ